MSTVRIASRRKPAAAAILVAMVALAILTSSVHAQTTIYDGSQQLNFFSASFLSGPLMLNNNPANETRNGIVQSGANPNVLEQGDAAWFRSSGRRMRNTNLGLAGSATGVDGDFMSSLFDASGATTSSADANGVGASYVLYDDGVTTGPQVLNFDLYYNDPTPNQEDGTGNGDGGVVAVRVQGVNGTGDAVDPWGTDEFTHLASSGSAAAGIAAGQHRDNSGDGVGPQVDNLLIENSRFGGTLTPSADWQKDISLSFDLGAGYEYIIFSFAGVAQPSTPQLLGADVFGFDNISFEEAPLTPGDFTGDGNVNGADLVQWQRIDGTSDGLAAWESNYGTTAAAAAAAVPEPSSAALVILAAGGLLAQARSRRQN